MRNRERSKKAQRIGRGPGQVGFARGALPPRIQSGDGEQLRDQSAHASHIVPERLDLRISPKRFEARGEELQRGA